MNETRRPNWFGKYSIEFTVIVVGVFIAVAAESWWSERQDRAFERDLRDDMVREFQANIRTLEADLAENADVTERFARLATLDDAELLALDDTFFNETYAGFPDWSGFDPEMGIVQAVVASGNTGVISDRELRLRLSRWSGLLTEKQRKTKQAVDYQIIVLVPTAASAADDRTWTAQERRQVQTHYASLALLQGLVVENQELLLEEAEAILEYLLGRE